MFDTNLEVNAPISQPFIYSHASIHLFLFIHQSIEICREFFL